MLQVDLCRGLGWLFIGEIVEISMIMVRNFLLNIVKITKYKDILTI